MKIMVNKRQLRETLLENYPFAIGNIMFDLIVKPTKKDGFNQLLQPWF